MDKKIKTSWDLSSLFDSDTDPQIKKTRLKLKKAASNFINKWKGRDDYLKDPKVLKIALDEYEVWCRNFGVSGDEGYYFWLRSAQDQKNPKLKAFLNKITDFSTQIENDIQFFSLNLAKIDPKTQDKFLKYSPLKIYHHYLEKTFEWSKHLLSDPEEKILNLKNSTSYHNWVDMTQDFLSREEKKILNEKGKKTKKNFSQIISLLNHQNKKVRDSAATAFNQILAKHLPVAEVEINSVLADKKVNDQLRNFSRPDKARHLSDDIDSQTIDTLIKAVSSRFTTAKKYYSLKAKLLGVKQLQYHERNLEINQSNKKYSYLDSIKLIDKVFSRLDPQFSQIFNRFVDNGQVDVFPRKSKSGGAFCTHGSLTQPVYLLLNHSNRLQDVLTFAHELGHGLNYEFIRPSQNELNFGTSTATAEVASTFMEDFVLDELLRQTDDKTRLSLMVNKLTDDISSIYRQVAFYKFEQELHSQFRAKGYLSSKQIGDLFQKHMYAYMGPSVEQSPGSQNWWVYVSHFRSFFYVYSYASGLLISKSLQNQVKSNPRFISQVKDFLATGLSDSPKNTFSKLGVDIGNSKFWNQGLDEVDQLLDQTQSLARKLGKI